jgi:hypothetical protein
MTEFGKRLIESAKEALEIAKGTAKPGTYRVSACQDGELQLISDFDESKVSDDDSATPKQLKRRASLKKTSS